MARVHSPFDTDPILYPHPQKSSSAITDDTGKSLGQQPSRRDMLKGLGLAVFGASAALVLKSKTAEAALAPPWHKMTQEDRNLIIGVLI
jgi:hypothetical protein